MTREHDKLYEVSERMETYLLQAGLKPFWGAGGQPNLLYGMLEEGLRESVRANDSVRSGRFAGAVDLWIASEFQRAGLSGLWPRLEEPRAIDPEVVRVSSLLPTRDSAVGERFVSLSGSANANVMGSVYVKQVDVGLSSWLAGPELLVSTKTMSGSFGKNLPNRFEEAYGDVKNLRARYPLAAHGVLFLVKSSIVDEPSAFEKAVHMLRQLQRGGDVYDATCLLVADWEEGTNDVRVPSEGQRLVPAELQPEQFFTILIELVLRQAPMDWHTEGRALYPGLS